MPKKILRSWSRPHKCGGEMAKKRREVGSFSSAVRGEGESSPSGRAHQHPGSNGTRRPSRNPECSSWRRSREARRCRDRDLQKKNQKKPPLIIHQLHERERFKREASRDRHSWARRVSKPGGTIIPQQGGENNRPVSA